MSGFAAVLSAAGCDYNIVAARNAPDSIIDMLDYKSMILVNTYIDDLPEGFLDNLETYVYLGEDGDYLYNELWKEGKAY